VKSERVATVLLLLVSIAGSMLAAELLLRWRRDSSISQREEGVKHQFNAYRADPVLSHTLRPSWSGIHQKLEFKVSVRTNALGFRGREIPAQPDPGTFRILTLGDSFTFGWGVEEEETFIRVLERRLSAVGRVEVINAGVPGYSADQYLLFLRTRGFALRPDAILLIECGNDDQELGWKQIWLDGDRLPTRVQSLVRSVTARGKMRIENWGGLLYVPSLRFEGDTWLITHSHLYNFVRFGLMRGWLGVVAERARLKRAELAGDPPPSDSIGTLSAEEIERGLAASVEFQTAYNRFLLDAIGADAAERGVPLRRFLIEGVSLDGRPPCVAPECLDQRDLFVHGEDPSMYLSTDGHWSAAGHAAVGEGLAAMLGADEGLGLARH
jgi:lysophospholipase L1-like esterase